MTRFAFLLAAYLVAVAPSLACSDSSVRPHCVRAAAEAADPGSVPDFPEDAADLPIDYWTEWTPVEDSTGFYINPETGEEEFVPDSPEAWAWAAEEEAIYQEYLASQGG